MNIEIIYNYLKMELKNDVLNWKKTKVHFVINYP